MNLVQRLIPTKFTSTRPGYKMVPKFITIHETDNVGLKANAEAHARLQENGNTRQASWHVQVDDTQAIQSIPFNEVAWAAGDGANGPGNRTSIHIEICVNKDGNYQKAVQNAAEVTKQLMQQLNIPLSNVVQHNHWSGKNCPSIMRSGSAGITWDNFLTLCSQEADSADGKLVRGEKGPNVQVLNQWLHELGYTFKTDDLFDQYTEAALLAFQKEHGLPQDAVYTSPIGDVIQKAIADKQAFQESAIIDAIPEKAPGKYRLAKFIDTDDPKLIDQYKKDGYKIIALP